MDHPRGDRRSQCTTAAWRGDFEVRSASDGVVPVLEQQGMALGTQISFSMVF